jgi:holo-[acyl-carrier protein] synthase
MRIIGHGIDAVKIAEIKTEVDSPNKKWTEQFCSADERECAGISPTRYRYYASCFAAKEAVVKALGTGFKGDITWRGIEILRRESGAPYIRLRDDVMELAAGMGITDWFISISYFDEVAMASVIAVGE